MNAIILDFDGTIADSFEQVLSFLCNQAGRDPASFTIEERAHLRGLSMKDLATAVGIPSWRLPIVYFRGKATLSKHMRKTPIFAGMESVLATLHNEKYQLFIMSSNSRRNILNFSLQHGLSGYFVRIYGNAGWFGKGPALKKLLKQHNLQPETTVYIGDEVRDVVAANIAGMPSIAVSWGFGSEEQLLQHNPTVLVRQPQQIEKTLIEWGKTF